MGDRTDSLMRILLGIDQVQPLIVDLMLERLPEYGQEEYALPPQPRLLALRGMNTNTVPVSMPPHSCGAFEGDGPSAGGVCSP